MKKNFLAIIAAIVALTACIGILVGCSNNTTGGNTNATTEPTQESTTGTTAAPETQEDVIGKIESVSDSFVKLVIYTATGEVTDYVTLDIAALTATQDTDYVYTASTTKYFKVVNGVKSDAARADLAVDALVASTTDAEGVQHIYIYSNEQGDSTQSPTDSSAGAIA